MGEGNALDAPTIDFVVMYRRDVYSGWVFMSCVNDQAISEFLRGLPTSYEYNIYQRVEQN